MKSCISYPNMKSLHGFTMVELMIALLLGIFVSAGAIQVFIGSKQSYRMQENMSGLQENGRFAMYFLTKDISMADYRICHKTSSSASAISLPVDYDPPRFLAGTDNISVTWQENTCDSAIVTKSTTYSIQEGSSGQPALFRRINAGNDEELIEGIENMQILYGVDNDRNKTPDYFVPAGTAGLDYAQVISVRISLLAQSSDEKLTKQVQKVTYPWPDSTQITPSDLRKRQVFRSTIAIRNRLP